jgi:hypothetical protein
VFIFSKAVVEDEEGSDEEDAADPTVTAAIVRYNIIVSGTSYILTSGCLLILQ